ncbi:LutC/YkgG family protein [Flavobacterium poyangense]|uniref:LutC/YkgG family protein n=1 Tax=Flavobacterium poyangense TaxID=2204302 RepID=UPI0014237F4D|nr:LUD domain-containing protein [Flavobacterium sp. JXAS1]
MSARDYILSAIAMNQPEFVEIPVIDSSVVIQYDDVYAQFKLVLESIGGRAVLISDITELQEQLTTDRLNGSFVVNTISAIGDVDEQVSSLSAFELEKVEKAYVKGTIGVAENGAVWVYESQMINRLIPFICQHLVLVLEKKDIVDTLHQAYERVEVSKEGFGVFIAGPSKTADIEQSLVIGAHGARSAVIYVIE